MPERDIVDIVLEEVTPQLGDGPLAAVANLFFVCSVAGTAWCAEGVRERWGQRWIKQRERVKTELFS